MKKQIALIDIGAGNLHSVYKALKFIGANVEITKDPKTIESSSVIVFPGVGAFGAVMESLKSNNLIEPIIETIKNKKPFLGICLGLQVLFNESEESPGVKGLSVLEGKVIKFKKAKKIPHIGWNDIEGGIPGLRLLGEKFYFVHSYYVIPDDNNIIYGVTNYDGEEFTSIIKKENLLAVQFHPEKSGDAGLEFLEEFLKNS